MSQKHIFNSSEGLVLKSLRGAVALNPSLQLDAPSKSVYVDPPSPNTLVSVISGGGAGHEPAHASYTGYGMLAASVSGDIFASPSSKQISSTIRLAARSQSHPDGSAPGDSSNLSRTSLKSVLVIINNYTGDRLNFGLAIEKARAEGISVDSVVIADDVSLLHSNSAAVGPRGLAGNILICKLLGAFAERGASLDEVKALGDAAVDNLASIGVGLEHCHVPGRDKAVGVGALLDADECEIGLGLHNEPGVSRVRIRAPEVLVQEMVGKILKSRDVDNRGLSFIREGDECVLFVNNLGGMSQLEMGAVLDEILSQLAKTEIHPSRVYLSSYMTSLNAPGFSLSLLNISNVHRSLRRLEPKIDINILQLLDDPTEALSWIGVRSHWPQTPVTWKEQLQAQDDSIVTNSNTNIPEHLETRLDDGSAFWQKSDISPEVITSSIIGACRAVLGAEKIMTRYDTVVGDGDCGTTLARGAKAVLGAINDKEIVVSEMGPAVLVRKISDVLEDHMGGTIGALFAIFFTAWSSALASLVPPSSSPPAYLGSIPGTLQTALSTLSHYTSAKPGDRTIMDALVPFVHTLKGTANIVEASEAAKEGALRTRGMQARLGRAVYVGHQPGGNPVVDVDDDRRDQREGDDDGGFLPPDPGAWGVAVLVEGFVRGVSGMGV